MPEKRTSPAVWIGIGCAAALLGLAGFVAVIAFIIFGAMRSSEPYTASVARAKSDPRVVAALGTPIETGWLVSGNINVENDDGRCDLNIPLHGPKQNATLHVAGTKTNGRWSYDAMTVMPERGPAIEMAVPR